MEIIIKGKKATIAKDSQFDLVFENSLFTGADAYSLNITFPLRGVPGNREIFGFLNRVDARLTNPLLDCELIAGAQIFRGAIAITEISDVAVTGQFLLGRSASNYNPKWDETYINEMQLGAPGDDIDPKPDLRTSAINPWHALTRYNYYALPWFNSNTTNTNIINDMRCHLKITDGDDLTPSGSGGSATNPPGSDFADNPDAFIDNWEWTEATWPTLSWMPNLLWLTEKICDGLGYAYNFEAWENDPALSKVIVCNTLPGSWGISDFARALPHWTVAEFFEKLELFLGLRISIDHRTLSISMATISEELTDENAQGQRVVKSVVLRNVVDEFTADISEEDQTSKYIGARNILYAECDHPLWKFYSCDWFIRNFEPRETFSTPQSLAAAMKAAFLPLPSQPTTAEISKSLLSTDIPEAYFLIHCFRQAENTNGGYRYYYTARTLNIAASHLGNPDPDAEDDKVEFVPCRIDQVNNYTDRCIFLPLGSFDEKDPDVQNQKRPDENSITQPTPVQILEAGQKAQYPEYFDRIYVAFWSGTGSALQSSIDNLPYPQIGPIEIIPTWSEVESDTMTGWAVRQYPGFDFSLARRYSRTANSLQKINPNQCYKIKFLSTEIPDPKAVYLIKGRKFVCSRLTASASEYGISPLIQGEFYPVDPD